MLCITATDGVILFVHTLRTIICLKFQLSRQVTLSDWLNFTTVVQNLVSFMGFSTISILHDLSVEGKRDR